MREALRVALRRRPPLRRLLGGLAQAIPAKIRTVIYSILGMAVGIEAIVDVVPADVENKTLAILVVLGFGVAVGNVAPKA